MGLKDKWNEADKKMEAWFKGMSKGQQKAIVGVALLFVGFLFLNSYYILGLSNLCENSGAELVKGNDGYVCVNMTDVKVCKSGNMLIDESFANNFTVDYNWSD